MIKVFRFLNCVCYVYRNAPPVSGGPPASADPYRNYGGGAPGSYPPQRPYGQQPPGAVGATSAPTPVSGAPPQQTTGGTPQGPYPPGPPQQFEYRPDQVCVYFCIFVT